MGPRRPVFSQRDSVNVYSYIYLYVCMQHVQMEKEEEANRHFGLFDLMNKACFIACLFRIHKVTLTQLNITS